ncbi:AraC family transcriptional regulator [Massilia pseudoviolaceinigra]|uniref:AraC family transcriptional regulator n=1 Tax=Massilia pseudoviolaceinigra TaxID=3057165 RepID=UPI002796A318|nr:AraC family transcriptional regulator [Massilia sp. CCM 9206]MDQ1919006.1 AraC family transcriptional regulator [Massilia sp. CCM 9206]
MPPVLRPDARRVTGSYLQPLLEAAQARGVAPAALAGAAGLPATALDRLPDSLGAADYVRLLGAGAELADDPHFGLHVGERVKLGTYSVYGLILLSCRDFGQAFQQTLRYEQLAHDLGRSLLHLDGEQAHYEWVSNYPEGNRHLVESVFAGIRTFSTWLAGAALPAPQLRFTHAQQADGAEYERIFGVLPRFGAPVNAAGFDAQLLGWPVPNADVGLYPVLQQHAEQLLRERSRRDDGVAAQVHAAIIRNLAHDRVRLATIAEELKLSPRTLQRKLSEAGASFQQVLDQARYALATDYLRQGSLSLVDIAFLLGYQEQSAFSHAFKEWSGVNPGAWRDGGHLRL